MSLKQIIYSDNALQKMPSVVKLLQTNKLPSESLLEIYANLSTLLNGTYTQRKIALCLLRSCLLNVMKQDNSTEHSGTILKWWRGVINGMKSRYTADIMFKMACINAALIIELSETNTELQGELRQHVPQLTASCLSHNCKESVEVLLALATYYPTVFGKSFEDVKLFCISNSRDDVRTADLFSKLTCVGPAGKHSINYALAWSKMFSDVMGNLHTLMISVMEQTVTGTNSILPCWTYTGSLDDYLKATDEMTWLTAVLSSLLSLHLSAPLTFPIKRLQAFVDSILIANTTTLIQPSTTLNVFKRSYVSSLTREFLGVLTQVVSVITTSSWLLQSSLEKLLSYLLQQKEHTYQVIDLLQSLTNHGASFNAIPTVCLLDLITPVTEENISHVDKKARNQEFDKMTVEFKPNIDEKLAEKTMVLLSSVIENQSSSVLKMDEIKQRCANLLEHRVHFNKSFVKETYKTSFMVARQQFDVGSVFKLFECEREIRHELSKELFDIEPHLHPERHVLGAERSVKEAALSEKDTVEEPGEWDKENAELFSNLPHRTVAVPKVNEMEDERMDEEEETEKTEDKDEIVEDNEDDSDLMADSELLNKIKNDFHKIQNSVPISHKPVDELQQNAKEDLPKPSETLNVKVDHGSQLLDILSSFVDDPPSDAE